MNHRRRSSAASLPAEEILDAANALFAERGYDELSGGGSQQPD